MRIIETVVYTIEEHPNKEKCYEWIRDHWFDLYEHNVNELIESIVELSAVIGGTNSYNISLSPDRGEYIRFSDYDEQKLAELNADEYPLTGVCYDMDLIVGLRNDTLNEVLDSLHEGMEYLYSDQGLFELCEANEYEFDENGKCV